MKNPNLEDIDNFVVPSLLANRIVRIHKVPLEFANGLIREAKRMLYLCIISDASVAPSDRVDWAWHEMLMFTSFYQEFSEYIGGFIHHVPNPPPEEEDEDEAWKDIQKTLGIPRLGSDTYKQTKTHYQKFFNITPDPLYWP